MHDVGGKLLSGIKSMYVDSLACVRVKGGESECFRIDSAVRQGCIMSPCLFNAYMDGVLKEVKRGMVEVCRRKGLKMNAGKCKVIVLGGEGRLEFEVCTYRIRLKHVSEFKYLGCALDESGADEAVCHRKVASGRRVAIALRSFINARGLQLEYARVLNESLLMSVLIYVW